MSNDQYRSAMIAMPTAAQMGGQQPWPGTFPTYDGQVPHQNPNGQQGAAPPQPFPAVAYPPPFVRVPFFPTAPWYSTNPNIGYQTRLYGLSVSSSESDYVVGSEMTRSMQFDLPCRIVAIQGAAASEADDPIASGVTEQNMNLLWKISIISNIGDKYVTLPRIAAQVVGTARNPGEIGGHGHNVDQGSTLQIGITPLADELAIDVTFVCLEMRAPTNFVVR